MHILLSSYGQHTSLGCSFTMLWSRLTLGVILNTEPTPPTPHQGLRGMPHQEGDSTSKSTPSDSCSLGLLSDICTADTVFIIPYVSSSAKTLLTTTEHQGRPRSFQGWGALSWTPIMRPQAFICVIVALFAGGASGPRLHQYEADACLVSM